MSKWEYKVVTYNEYNPVNLDSLDLMGEEGWELVSIVTNQIPSYPYHYNTFHIIDKYYFKRLKENKKKEK